MGMPGTVELAFCKMGDSSGEPGACAAVGTGGWTFGTT